MSDFVSRKYLLDIATSEGAYDYVSADEIASAPSVNDEIIKRLKEMEKFNNSDVPSWVWNTIERM